MRPTFTQVHASDKLPQTISEGSTDVNLRKIPPYLESKPYGHPRNQRRKGIKCDAEVNVELPSQEQMTKGYSFKQRRSNAILKFFGIQMPRIKSSFRSKLTTALPFDNFVLI